MTPDAAAAHSDSARFTGLLGILLEPAPHDLLLLSRQPGDRVLQGHPLGPAAGQQLARGNPDLHGELLDLQAFSVHTQSAPQKQGQNVETTTRGTIGRLCRAVQARDRSPTAISGRQHRTRRKRCQREWLTADGRLLNENARRIAIILRAFLVSRTGLSSKPPSRAGLVRVTANLKMR
jgi:hypothetical protein